MTKSAIVTGCSSGFGLLAAIELARGGYRVAATMRDPGRQERLLQAAADESVARQIAVLELDVTNHAQARHVVDDVLGRFGRIDVLVNNAGYAQGGFAEEVGMDVWREQFETNVFGVIAMTQAVIPHMRRQRHGRIIQISSISGLVGFPGLSPYNASKYAVEGFSEALRHELLADQVYVSIVEPGSYKTAIWEKGLAGLGTGGADSGSGEPSGRLRALKALYETSAAGAGDPRQVAELIARIADHPKPRLRYPVGKGMRALLLARRLLPWSAWETLVRSQIGSREARR